MSINNVPKDDPSTIDTAGERKLRGSALKGSEQKVAADHTDYEEGRNPDTELQVDGEPDSLYNDGIDIQPDSAALAGTRGKSSGIKP
jgi:hypothetical protein